MQQRVFVGDLQHFSIVEIGQSTKARDVISMVDEKGELPPDTKAGGWMLFELSNDFGMGESLETLFLFSIAIVGEVVLMKYFVFSFGRAANSRV